MSETVGDGAVETQISQRYFTVAAHSTLDVSIREKEEMLQQLQRWQTL